VHASLECRPDLREAFADIGAWQAFLANHLFLHDTVYVRAIVDHAVAHGVTSSFLGRLRPEEVRVADTNYRESLLAAGLNPRQRAVLEMVAGEPWFSHPISARIYAAEALTPFALAMRGRFPRFIGSEYASDLAARKDLYPIEFQDLSSLTLPSEVFCCVITNDCLEHVPDINVCLKEMARVLKPGGVMLSTFPFSFRYESIVKAKLVNGAVEYLAEPEYHGNPAEPEKGSLVFEIPGWEILERARAAGFSRSEMVFLSSVAKGITGADIAGEFVLRCYR